MREDTKRRLEAALAGDVYFGRMALLAGAALCAIFGLWLVASQTTISDRRASGVVQRAIWRINVGTGQRYPDFYVALDDGRLVTAGTLNAELPAVGTRVTLHEMVRLTGYHSFFWEGAVEQVEKP